MTVLEKIVKANDIRGIVPDELTPDVSRSLGAAFADTVNGPMIVVGHDMRQSSPVLVDSFTSGITDRGKDVTLIGLCSTDGLYHASGSLNAPAAMFTASHNPANYNGMKLCHAGARPVGRETGLAEVQERAQDYLDHGIEPVEEAGSVREQETLREYSAYLRSLVPMTPRRRLKVVVDAGNGMAGLTAGAVLSTDVGLADLGVDLVRMYFDLDGTFPNHEPNPLDPANLVDLQAAVIAEEADLGLGFDGDADRCFVIDNNGVAVNPSAITALVGLREVRKEQTAGRDGIVIHNLITSRAVEDLITAAGGRTIATRVGHAFIKEQMSTHDAVFGGEHSAHYYFRDFYYADSGMLAALHVLSALAESEITASDIATMYTPYAASGEINSTVADVEAIATRLRKGYRQEIDLGTVSVDDLDGLTFSHWNEAPRWWFNVRPSNTEPLVRLNVEAEDEDVMEKIRDGVLQIIREEQP